ncbi:MAG: hypothetical protein IPJ89_03285 [Candidatus Iainarchaeum archaeon]|uniref:Uncharacterized protein n=1 Tax=Candidatus Iainarchaeum sp. TaxID=3101447 RepID=A0A7T9DIU3_9ARCH|nr:MAG: hypothetical protein IPJ89_03285 [Candidatus Diapherotrites archaeon]
MKPRPHHMPSQRGVGQIVSRDIHLVSIGEPGGKQKGQHILRPGHRAEAETHPLVIGHPGQIAEISARSVLARHGVEVHFDQSQIPEIRSGHLPSRVFLTHSGEIPVRLRRGNRTHRVYYPHHLPTMPVAEVRARMAQGDLQLGKDFKILRSGMLELTVPNIIYHVDPAQIPAIAKNNWVSGSKRSAFQSNFTRVEGKLRTRDGIIVLSETLPVKLPKDIALLLYGGTDGKSRHIHSLFIDPGFSGPIVLEIQGLGHKGKPEKIIARLVKVTP